MCRALVSAEVICLMLQAVVSRHSSSSNSCIRLYWEHECSLRALKILPSLILACSVLG
jgi:hypothetical protein